MGRVPAKSMMRRLLHIACASAIVRGHARRTNPSTTNLAAPILVLDVAAGARLGRGDVAHCRDLALRAAADIGIHA